jgi:hypothetical protein
VQQPFFISKDIITFVKDLAVDSILIKGVKLVAYKERQQSPHSAMSEISI